MLESTAQHVFLLKSEQLCRFEGQTDDDDVVPDAPLSLDFVMLRLVRTGRSSRCKKLLLFPTSHHLTDPC